MKQKQKLGQFMTTNFNYILQDLYVPENINIIEPFVGKGHLCHFVSGREVKKYDIDPQIEGTIKQDTLLNPPSYLNQFILTNPPYLARNKSPEKYIFDKYKVNDLYKCFIKELITNQCLGGILIIPLNFFCSIRKNDVGLRREFLTIYSLTQLNIFEERVFEDTSYTICSFQFEKKRKINNSFKISLYPEKREFEMILNEENNFTFGNELYQIQNNKVKITRATKNNKSELNTKLLVNCIDSKRGKKISLEISQNPYIDETEKVSARSFASLIITPPLDISQQEQLVVDFNNLLTEKRVEYNSLFLTNYRDFGRKRISFDLVYKLIKFILKN